MPNNKFDLTPFLTRKEVKAYLNKLDNRIECLICQRSFKSLAGHLMRTHDISADEYKTILGIPVTWALASKDTLKKKREVTTKLGIGVKNLTFGYNDHIKKADKTTWRPQAKVIRQEVNKRLARDNASGKMHGEKFKAHFVNKYDVITAEVLQVYDISINQYLALDKDTRQKYRRTVKRIRRHKNK